MERLEQMISKHSFELGEFVSGFLLAKYLHLARILFKPILLYTVFSPQKYNLTPTVGIIPVEKIQAVLEECADNAQEVEIQFEEQQTKFGVQMQVFIVKSLPKKKIMKSNL